MACATCDILFGNEPGYAPKDEHGCLLPSGHAEPHEFIATDGVVYQWETDWECDCDHCMNADGDYCTTYWKKDATAEQSGDAREGGA